MKYTGQKIDRYTVIDLLATGSEGRRVLKARTPEGEIVAIKCSPTTEASTVVSHFDEWELGKKFAHPNIPRYSGAGNVEMDGKEFLYMVVQFVDGLCLAQNIQRLGDQRSLPPLVAAQIGLEVARALSYLHQMKDERGGPLLTIHLDIKPGNVLLGRDRVLLADFGTAQFRGQRYVAPPKTVRGTSFYMSPEQTRGISLTSASDMFSFGTLLYEMVVGKTPFSGSTSQEIAEQIARATQQQLKEKVQEVQVLCPELTDAMRACYQVESWDRWSADRVVSSLEYVVYHLQKKRGFGYSDWLRAQSQKPKIPTWALPCSF